MKFSTILSIVFCLFVFESFAQQNPKAIQVLDKAREVYQKSNSVFADFEIAIYQKNKIVSNEKGTIKMKGNKFRVSTDDAELWFDGKNQWILPNGTEEVSLSAPTEAEQDAVNPASLFQIYHKGFNSKYVSAKLVNGKMVDIIDLIPSRPKQDITKITVNVDQKSSVLTLIFIQNKNGNHQKINITNYKSGMNYTDNQFVFNSKQFPKVEVVDLR